MSDLVRKAPEDELNPYQIMADHLAAHAFARNTIRAYESDLNDFLAFCRTCDPPCGATPESVAQYAAFLSEEAGAKPSTIRRRLAAIHKIAPGAASRRHPRLGAVLSGIERTRGNRQQGKAALLIEDLRRLLASLPPTLLGCRDRAILLLGFAGAFRRSELTALAVEDLQFQEEGLAVLLRASKTDQSRQGRFVGIPYGSDPATCPVRAVQRWIKDAGLSRGPLFLGFNGRGHLTARPLAGQAVWDIVKRSCRRAGLPEGNFGAHSLRSGMVTQAIRGGASDHAILAQTGHQSSQMLRRYRRDTDLFRDNAATKLEL